MAQIELKELAGHFRTLAQGAELLGQERAISAVLDQLQVRGADEQELAIFERLIRERLEYQQ